MFLTHMALDENRPETQALLKSPLQLEQAVLSTFAGGNLMPLFRLDELGHRRYLLMLTQLRPTMVALHQRYGFLGAFPSWMTESDDDLLDQAEPGTRWHFTLSARPWGDLPPEEWLAAEGEAHGFRLLQCHCAPDPFYPAGDGGVLLRWEGLLEVTDPSGLVAALHAGFGIDRAHGFGLMTLER